MENDKAFMKLNQLSFKQRFTQYRTEMTYSAASALKIFFSSFAMIVTALLL